MLKQISLRVPAEVIIRASKLGELEHYDKSVLLRRALEIGMLEIAKDSTFELYSEGKLTISEAAELANMAVGEFMSALIEHGIKSNVTLKDVKAAGKVLN